MARLWSCNYLRQKVLEEIVPSEGREAMKQGGVFVHSLEHYFGPDLALPDYRDVGCQDGAELMLSLAHDIKRDSFRSAALCLPHFDTDLGFLISRFWPHEDKSARILSRLFELFCQTPRHEVTVNLGDDTTEAGRRLTRIVLNILASGHTYLEPQVVFRVRKGTSFAPSDTNYDLLMLALDLARDRKGIAFSLMDSALNSQWMNLVTYNSHGLRVEPQHGDLYLGCRGQVVPGRVSLNVPLLESYGEDSLLQALGVAARLLAHRLEVVQSESLQRTLPLIINLVGLSSNSSVFDCLALVSKRVLRLREEYGRNFLLSATADDVRFTYSTPGPASGLMSPVLAASLQHMLPGGHCYLAKAGTHRSKEELYHQLAEAQQVGVSFLRFSVDDTRCAACALPVAASGPCPACGTESRRTVIYNGSRLEECMRNADNPESPTVLWLSS
ncbi:MAG: ribonucleoside-triphosphate reductase [Bacillota bacterium]|nr:MAG: ribonucleoside-triphosphate reductase [Bacillota bacterium]